MNNGKQKDRGCSTPGPSWLESSRTLPRISRWTLRPGHGGECPARRAPLQSHAEWCSTEPGSIHALYNAATLASIGTWRITHLSDRSQEDIWAEHYEKAMGVLQMSLQ